MSKKQIIAKLTSRKFWMAVSGLAISVMTITGADAETQTQVTGLIMAGATVVAYIVGEGLVDASNKSE